MGLALGAGGCSLSMSLAGLQPDPQTTASAKTTARLDPALDDEDWRRAQSALSLAVDPQGSGAAVNWDNPATKRKGSFVPTGKLELVENTVCRPFRATVQDQQAGKPREAKLVGQACRTGPGEWAMRNVTPEGATATTTASTGAPLVLRTELNQPLPGMSTSMLPEAKADAPRLDE
jgi:surface antigen